MGKLMHMFAVFLLGLAMLLPVQSGVRAEVNQPLVVVVGVKTNLTDISLAMLRRAFQGEGASTSDGKRLVPLNHAVGSSERALFDRAVLGLEPSEVGRFWINRRIRDEGAPPRTLPSADMGVRVVASYPGAITYVSAKNVNANVRVLRIDGKLPQDAGYLLTGR
ncbi:MAG: hypothetical protein QM778_25225 [Myxococcales bacterium]